MKASKLGMLLALIPGNQFVHAQTTRPTLRYEPFDYHGVTIDSGPLRYQLDEIRQYYLAIPDDDLLKPYRLRAGWPAPGNELGGWYRDGIFHVFGQIISGLSRLYAVTGDRACREKAIRLFEGWRACIAADGYFYTKTPSPPHYVYDKFVGGLVDLAVYADCPAALPTLARITSWAEKHLDRSREYGVGLTEWYTLSENLYRAYLATGDSRYLDFAKVWEYTAYWDRLRKHEDLFKTLPASGFYHAYSHVNTLGGAGAAWLATGRSEYLDILHEAYKFLQDTQFYPTGGFGPDEQLKLPGQLARSLTTTTKHFETQCGSWAGYKMSRYLICASGDARYGDWVERLLWNGMAATLPSSPDGRAFYYCDYNLYGGKRGLIDIQWSCCSGTRPIAAAELHNQIYFRTASEILVNQFIPSTVRWSHEGAVTLRQETTFPRSLSSTLTISLERPSNFTISVRQPEWLDGVAAFSVNGQITTATSDPAHHISRIVRTWNDGDRLTVDLPRRLRIQSLAKDSDFPAALVEGPVVLVLIGREELPELSGDEIRDLPARLQRIESLHYRLPGTDWRIQPFYEVPANQMYWMFLDPAAGRFIPHGRFKYSGEWNDSGPFHFTKSPGAAAECSFRGTGFRWIGNRFPDAGLAEVKVDGEIVESVDQYGPARGLPFEWLHENLPPGRHTVRITASGRKRSEATDIFINVSGLQISPEDAGSVATPSTHPSK